MKTGYDWPSGPVTICTAFVGSGERPLGRFAELTQDVADLPRLPVEPRTIGRTFIAPDGTTYRPSMFVTLTLGSYGKVIPAGPGERASGAGSPVWPSRYDYRRAAVEAMFFSRLFDRWVQNLRRCAGFVVQYFDHVQPVAPRSLDTLLAAAAESLPEDHPGRNELESIANAFGRLPPSWATDRESVRERHRDKEVLRSRLAALCASSRTVSGAIDAEVERINGDDDLLDALLERQNYRLAFWRTAGQELDYRRFFDITTLIGLRMEDQQVFDDSHRLVLQWVADGTLDGLRIDHPDGLLDPAGYLRRLHDA